MPVSGGVKVVPGVGQLARAGLCQPIKRPFPTSRLGRGEHAVSRLPLLPPIPRFICLEQLLAFRQDWLARAVSQQLPQITTAGLKNGPLKQRRLTKAASLYLTAANQTPAMAPHWRFAPAACRAQSAQFLSARCPEAVDTHRCPAAAKLKGSNGARDKIRWPLFTKGKEGMAV